jgi:hypothetical protein
VIAQFYSDLDAFIIATGGHIPVSAVEREDAALRSGRYRLEHGLATGGRGIAIVWGGYGFATFYLAKRVRYCRIFGVVPLKALRSLLQQVFKKLEIDNVTFVGSVQELNEKIIQYRYNIDFSLFLCNAFDNRYLDVFPDMSIKFLSGEFNPAHASPVQVYRQSKRVAEKFIWTWGDEQAPVVGTFASDPEVSIIVPAFNAECTIKRCLDSLTSQTIEKREIIIVNDGSTDKTGEIADEYASLDSSVKVLHLLNGGPGAARAAGLKLAKGIYIGFVDSDDYCEPAMFEALF